MTDRYVRSGAAGAGTGADWANAFTTLSAAITAGAAGDTYYISEDHAQTQASALTLTMKGTKTAPDRFLCVDHLGTVPPVSADLRTTATISTTGANALGITAGVGYWYGIIFNGGTGASSVNNNISASVTDADVVFGSCSFRTAVTTGGFYRIGTGTSGTNNRIELVNTTFSFGATGAGILARGGTILWRNTASALLGTIPTNLFLDGNTNPSFVTLDGVDLSAHSGTLIATQTASGFYILNNCKLHASATVAATPTSTAGPVIINSGSGSTTNCARVESFNYRGTLTTETTIIRTSPAGASDGVVPVSWKLVSTANSKASFPFISPPIAIWNTTTGGSKTATIQIVNDGVTLTNADIWVEAEYLGSSATPVSSVVSAGLADVLAAGANLSTSTDTWTTTGLGSPVKQKISVTFTPNMVGPVRLIVKLARASTTVYVDPLITIS